MGKPIKKDVDLSPQRWELPIHILDALFYCELGYISVPGFDQSAEGGALLQELRQVVSAGIESKFLINTPHLVLLEVTYDTKIHPYNIQCTRSEILYTEK